MHSKHASRVSSLFAFVVISSALISCGGSGSKLSDYVSRVAAVTGGTTVTATQRSGRPPGGSGPAITASSGGAVSIAGGSTAFQIASTTTYGGLAVSVDGVDGYFELPGLTPGSGNTVTIFVTIGQNAPQTFNLQVAAGTATSYGTAQVVPVQLTPAGTGDVQVNVSWDVDSDVDLHVVEPGGTEIYYANKGPTLAGGTLDLDSNAACAIIDHKRSENIAWPSGRAPRGTYTVRVDLWSACTQARTNYVVTVNVKGQPPQYFNGFFLAADEDAGMLGSGRTITTFTY
jgi:hypothetical protein